MCIACVVGMSKTMPKEDQAWGNAMFAMPIDVVVAVAICALATGEIPALPAIGVTVGACAVAEGAGYKLGYCYAGGDDSNTNPRRVLPTFCSFFSCCSKPSEEYATLVPPPPPDNPIPDAVVMAV